MSEEGDLPVGIEMHRHVRHYHGDTVRVLFIIAAVVLLLAATTGALLPLTMLQTVTFAVILVVAAGITNPLQTWIHWANAALSIFGAITFGMSAIEHYQATHDLFNQTFLYIEILAIVFLISVYFATKTVRGILLRPHLS